MPRLHNERSRPYPERPVRYAIQLPLESAKHGNMPGSQAGVSRGHSVRWAAHRSGGLKSLWRSDEGRYIQKRG